MATAAPAGSGAAFGFNTPFAQQLAFFQQKLKLPTKQWDDIRQSAHDRAFIVAGAAQADLLTDLKNAVERAIAKGTGLEAFRKDFKTLVAANGWTGWTGEGTAAGVAWRTKVIYQTNLATSFAAGRWAQLTDPATAAGLPFWRYVHADSVLHPRPLHQEWNGLTLPLEHEFWRSHFPPNGWGCRCRIRPERKVPPGAKTTPPEGWNKPDPKTGAPKGIDKGFAYAPGATWHPDLDKYPFETARQIVADNLKDGVLDRWVAHIGDQVAKERVKDAYAGLTGEKLSQALRVKLADKERVAVAVLNEAGQKALKVGPDTTHTVWLSDDTLIKQIVHHEGQDLPVGGYLRLQEVLDAAMYVEESGDLKLIYYHDGPDIAVAVVKTTADRKELFLVSMRKARRKALDKAIEDGRAIKWT